jgi:hypothetical protein
MALTVAFVPTGMNTGVSMRPRPVHTIPRRAADPVAWWVTAKASEGEQMQARAKSGSLAGGKVSEFIVGLGTRNQSAYSPEVQACVAPNNDSSGSTLPSDAWG